MPFSTCFTVLVLHAGGPCKLKYSCYKPLPPLTYIRPHMSSHSSILPSPLPTTCRTLPRPRRRRPTLCLHRPGGCGAGAPRIGGRVPNVDFEGAGRGVQAPVRRTWQEGCQRARLGWGRRDDAGVRCVTRQAVCRLHALPRAWPPCRRSNNRRQRLGRLVPRTPRW